MAIEVKIPAINQSFYSDSVKKQTKDKLDSIYLKYKTYIDQAARLTNVDKDMITSLIFIESAGNPDAVSHAGAVGLMQLMITPQSPTPTDVLVMENLKQRLTEPEKVVLRKQLGSRLDGILKMKYRNHIVLPEKPEGIATYTDSKGATVKSASWVTKKDLLNPEFNILVGAIYLGLLIDESVESGKLRLDKIIVRYNRGYGANDKGKSLPATLLLAMSSNLPKETKEYILKFAGLNGTLDLLKA